MGKESNYKCKCTFCYLNYFLMGRIGLVGTEEIRNIRLQVYEFYLQITTFYIYSFSLFALLIIFMAKSRFHYIQTWKT